MDDETIGLIIIIIGSILLLGTISAVIVLDNHNSTVDNNETIKLSGDDSKSHVIIPISTGSGTNYAVV